MKRILFFPDAQIPYHNPLMLRSLIRFIHNWQPDEVCIIGDFMDFPQPSVWSKNTRFEFEGSIFTDCELGKRALAAIRNGFSGRVTFIEGNHDSRARVYHAKYAPALAESKAFHIGTLLDFDGFGIEETSGFYDFHDGWTATHGHLGFTLSNIGARTAVLAATSIQRSVVMGHTHRLGVISDTKGYDGKPTLLTGVEVGHIMDVRPGKTPAYLKKGMANWQSGFAIAYINNAHVSPVTVPMLDDGGFIFEGKLFGAEERVNV